jgi:ketosteroid isomerase-like protein
MSEENVEIVRRAFDAFGSGELEESLVGLAPTFEFHPSGRFMDTQSVYRGPEGMRDFWRTFRDAWEELRIDIERIEDLGDRVLTLGTFHGRTGGTDAEVRAESGWIHTFEDGLIVRLRSFATWAEALEAAGLSG